MKKITKFLGPVVIIAMSVIWSCSIFADASIFVGVLEQFDKKAWSREVGKESINPRIRVAFFKDKNNWQATKSNFSNFEELTSSAKNYPNQMSWYVINDRNILGELITQQYTPKLYRDAGVQEIVGELAKKIQLPPTKNLQFPMIKMDHKPLIVISKAHNTSNDFKDSEAWIPSKPTDSEMSQVLKELPQKVLPSKNSYEAKNVQVIEAYRLGNELLIGVVVKNLSKDDYFSRVPYWFHITNSFTINFLGAGLNLIDIADLDHDGRDEFIFMYSDPENVDQNSNGYVLFSDNFTQSARFLWSNH